MLYQVSFIISINSSELWENMTETFLFGEILERTNAPIFGCATAHWGGVKNHFCKPAGWE